MNAPITMNKLVSDKIVKRGDLFRVKIDGLVIVEGFNDSRRFNDPDELRAHIDAMKTFVLSGGKLPPIEVAINPETGDTEVVEGHCRTACYRELLLEGAQVDGEPLEYISATAFKGTMAERRARIVTSNNQLPLSKVGEAKVYRDMRDMDSLSAAEIAKMVNRSRAHIDQMLLLADGGEEVHQAVSAGVVSPTEAVKIIREFKTDAPAEIERRKEVAAELGKDRVTAATATKEAKPKKTKTKVPDALEWAARAVYKSIEPSLLESVILGNSADRVEVDAGILAELLMAIADVPEADEAQFDDGQMDMLGEENE